MKSPDEIKKAIECCWQTRWKEGFAVCNDCPYLGTLIPACKEALERDALAYIQQLEAERDAAVADVRLAYTSYVGACQTCKHVKDQVDCDNPLGCGHCGEEKCKCNTCDNDYSNWEWRGVQKEDGNAKSP